jgi:hypothetical protein
MERDDSRFSASIVCIDTVIPAPVQAHYAYTWKDIRVNHRFVEVYTQLDEHSLTVDYGSYRRHRTHSRRSAAKGPRSKSWTTVILVLRRLLVFTPPKV